MKKSITLSTPIEIKDLEVASLVVRAPFRSGYLRGAPATPPWFIRVVRELMTKLLDESGNGKKLDDLEDEELLKEIGLEMMPESTDIDALVPWLLHIAEKATRQPADVVDQLDVVDLLKIIWVLLPGMMSLVNFRKTSASGEGTSPGSGTGHPQK